MKYFVLGAFSSAFLLYGIALVYGATGSTNLAASDPSAVACAGDRRRCSAQRRCCSPASRCCSSGFGFKVAAVPFHSWTPDVYQGAPTPVDGVHGVGASRPPRSPACCGSSSSRFAHYAHRLAAGRLGAGRR